MNRLVLVLLLLMLSPSPAAQEDGASGEQNGTTLEALEFDKVFSDIAAQTPAIDATVKQARVQNEFYYVVILALLCLVSLILVLMFLLKLKQDTRPKDIVAAAGLILIVFGTIILVLIVDTSEQLTAAIGILGAVAGYLFRSAQEGREEARLEREP